MVIPYIALRPQVVTLIKNMNGHTIHCVTPLVTLIKNVNGHTIHCVRPLVTLVKSVNGHTIHYVINCCFSYAQNHSF